MEPNQPHPEKNQMQYSAHKWWKNGTGKKRAKKLIESQFVVLVIE